VSNERKIRNLIEKDPIEEEKVTLDQIIFKATNMTPVLTDLEYGNKRTHIVEAKKQCRDLKNLVRAFEMRLKDEVYPEVIEEKDKHKHKYPGDVSKFKKSN